MVKPPGPPTTIRSRSRDAALASPIGSLLRNRYWLVSDLRTRRISGSPAVPLVCVIGTWHEADVIAANAAHARQQGCDAVIVVDNGSTDGTRHAAESAGAEVFEFTTRSYDEGLRVQMMRTAATQWMLNEGCGDAWALYLDADEFVFGPAESTVADFLRGLDPAYSVVGARYYEHFPDPGVDFDVADVLGSAPWYLEHPVGYCFRHHHKHPLIRHRLSRDTPDLAPSHGFHRVRGARGLKEPAETVVIRHFPYRDQELTLRRLRMLCGGGEHARVKAHEVLEKGAESNSSRRLREGEAVYAGDWDSLDLVRRLGPLRRLS